MRPNIWFAPKVIDNLSAYRRGRDELLRLEVLLETTPFVGREYVKGIPAIRAINKLFGDPHEPWPHVGTLTWYYMTAPLADLVPGARDEIAVFHVGKVSLKEQISPGDYEFEEIQKTIIEIYGTVRLTV